jgi:hypothetical protein
MYENQLSFFVDNSGSLIVANIFYFKIGNKVIKKNERLKLIKGPTKYLKKICFSHKGKIVDNFKWASS